MGSGPATLSQGPVPPMPVGMSDIPGDTRGEIPLDGDRYVYGTNGLLNMVAVQYGTFPSVRNEYWIWGLLMTAVSSNASNSYLLAMNITDSFSGELLNTKVAAIKLYCYNAVALALQRTSPYPLVVVYSWLIGDVIATSEQLNQLVLGRTDTDFFVPKLVTAYSRLNGTFGEHVHLECGQFHCVASSPSGSTEAVNGVVYRWGVLDPVYTGPQTNNIGFYPTIISGGPETTLLLTSDRVYAIGINAALRFGQGSIGGTMLGNRTVITQAAYAYAPVIVELPPSSINPATGIAVEYDWTDILVGGNNTIVSMRTPTGPGGNQRTYSDSFVFGKLALATITNDSNSELPGFGLGVQYSSVSMLPARLDMSSQDHFNTPIVWVARAKNFTCYLTQNTTSTSGSVTNGPVDVHCGGIG